MNAPAPASIPVIAIQESDLWKMEQPDFMVRPYDAIDEATLFDIMGEIQPASAIIIESDVFRGCEIPLHTFLRQTRERKGMTVRILVLRCKTLGRENAILADSDRAAGANDVLWYQLSMTQKELTEKISAFIRNGTLSSKKETWRKSPVTADTAEIFPDAKVKPVSVPSKRNREAPTPPLRQKKTVPPPVPKSDFPLWLSRPRMNPIREGNHPPKKTQADSPAKASSIDTIDPGGRHSIIHLLGHTLILRTRYLAEHLSRIVKNGSIATPYSDISKTKAGALVCLSNLRKILNEIRPGLGKCIVSDPGIGAHFNSNTFVACMNRRNW